MDYKFGAFLIIAQFCGALALPPCVCTRNLRPVCGSDGVTYSNQCVLDCEVHQSGKEITTISEGPCLKENCICPLNYAPVCGNDGETYPNECALDCNKKNFSPRLKMVHYGQCKKPEQPPCICTAQYEPVCGSDGNTYGNDCELNCATANPNNSLLSIAHRGPCDNSVKVVNN